MKQQLLEDLMQRAWQMGRGSRHQQEVACIKGDGHKMQVLGLAGDLVFTYRSDCLLLRIGDIPVNSLVAGKP